jgi:hypothetical protein
LESEFFEDSFTLFGFLPAFEEGVEAGVFVTNGFAGVVAEGFGD